MRNAELAAYRNWVAKLKRRYNLTPSDWNKLMEAQNYVCAFCRMPFHNSVLSVDHSHKTGQVRGIVHKKCNIFIGYLENNRKYVESYLAWLPA